FAGVRPVVAPQPRCMDPPRRPGGAAGTAASQVHLGAGGAGSLRKSRQWAVGSRQYANGRTLIKRWHMGRADHDLKKASEHVNYEFDMFLATASFLTTGAG